MEKLNLLLNDTEEGKQLNRRVEFVVLENNSYWISMYFEILN